MARKVVVSALIKADDKASKTIDQVDSRFGRLWKTLRLGKVVAASAVASLAAVTATLVKSVKAAQTQEDAINKLNAALASLGPAADGVSKRLQEQASALQKVTKFGDEAIIQGQALVASFTRNEEQIKAATKAALDLAAATGTDLKSAFLLLGRAAAGETGTLSRYGIVIEEGLEKSERFAAAIEAITRQFGGQAQAQAKTFSGAVSQLQNAFGDLLEVIGDAITKNQDLRSAITRITRAIQSEGFIRAVREATDVIAEMASGFVRMVEVGSKVARTIGGPLLSAFRSLTQLIANQFVPEVVQATGDLDLLSKKVEETRRRNAELRDEMRSSASSMREAGEAAHGLAANVEEAAKSAGDATTQFESLDQAARVLGQTTSIQLENQILQMTLALEEQREALGENSAEFRRLRAVYEETVANLRLRIRNLREGLGDLEVGTRSVAESVRAFGDESEASARKVERLARTVRETRVEMARSATEIRRNVRPAAEAGGGRRSSILGSGQFFPELANVRIRATLTPAELRELRRRGRILF